MNTSFFKSKLALYLGIAGITLLVAIGVVMTRRLSTSNEAAFSGDVACRQGSCSIDPSTMNPGDYGKWRLNVYKNGIKLPEELLINSNNNAVLSFPVDDLHAQYLCRFEPIDENAGLPQTCGSTSQQNSCGPKQCACDIAGGLDCSDRSEDFVDDRQEGPGLIIIKPKYTGPADSCFVCDEIIFRDASSEKTMNARFDCQGNWKNYSGPPPVPTGVRLHQADGQSCRSYEGMVIGHNPTLTPELTPNPVQCGNCEAKVCCPACEKPSILSIPGSTTGQASCSQSKCNFSILNGDRCLAVGEELQVKVELQKDGACIDFDDEFAQNLPDGSGNKDKKVCGLKNGNIVKFKYVDGGVYDITLDCDPGHTNPQGIPDTRKNELVCRKRITAACPIGPISPGPSGSPTPTLSPTPTPKGPTNTPTPSQSVTPPPLCPLDERLNVRIHCPNCDQ